MITYYTDMKSRMGERGQITIPKVLRDRLGLRPGQIVRFEESEGGIVLRKQMSRDPIDAVYGTLETSCSSDELVAQLRDGAPKP